MFDRILQTLGQLTFLGERYAVGGCVRDALSGLEPHDVDVATPLHPEEVMRRAEAAGVHALPTGIAHGTVTLLLEEPVEVTTYRRDIETDGRHARVGFAGTLEDDLARRDFTMNALAVDPAGQLTDPFGGVADLQAGRLRAVGDPEARFREDYLRMVRGLRFANRFGLELEAATQKALYSAAAGVNQHVSVERVVDEFNKAFAHDGAGTFVRDLYRVGVLQDFIPEFAGFDELAQHPEHHPEGSVLEHTCLVVAHAPAAYRWHALLHDIGKRRTAERSPRGPWYSFKEHERVGAEMVPGIAQRLKLSAGLTDSLVATTRLHMQPLHLWRSGPELSLGSLDPVGLSPRAVRRLQSAAGVHLEALEAVCRADRVGRTGPTDAFLDTLFTPLAKSETTPVLMGRHLVEAGWKPGPHFGPALARAFEYQLETGCTDIPTLLRVAAG